MSSAYSRQAGRAYTCQQNVAAGRTPADAILWGVVDQLPAGDAARWHMSQKLYRKPPGASWSIGPAVAPPALPSLTSVHGNKQMAACTA